MDTSGILTQLSAMSRTLGLPEHDCVILGEGNTSARVGESSYWIKASGQQLHRIEASGFVELQRLYMLNLKLSLWEYWQREKGRVPEDMEELKLRFKISLFQPKRARLY